MRLQRLYDAYADKAFQLVVISPHELAELQETLIKQYAAKYWIGSDSRLQTLIDYVVPRVPAEFPMTYLIDSRGTVVEFGTQLEPKIEYLLQEVFDPRLGRDLDAQLAPACEQYEAQAVGRAWTLAAAQLQSATQQLVTDATYLRGRCEAYGAWQQLMLEREITAGDLPVAVRKLKQIEKKFVGMPTAAWAAETRAKLEQDPKVKMESILGEPLEHDLGRALHAGLGHARKQYEAGLYGVAWTAAGTKLAGDVAPLAEDAAFLRERCEAYGEWHSQDALRDLEMGAYAAALRKLTALAKTCKGMPTATWAVEKRRELESDPKVKLELKAWTRLERALARATKAAGDTKRLAPVLAEYRAIRDAYPGTFAAREADRLLR